MKQLVLFDLVQGTILVSIGTNAISAKAIKTMVSVNKKRSIEELENLVKNLQKELTAMRKYVKKLESQITLMQVSGCKDLHNLQNPDYNPATAAPFDFKKAREGIACSFMYSLKATETADASEKPSPSTPMTPKSIDRLGKGTIAFGILNYVGLDSPSFRLRASSIDASEDEGIYVLGF